VNIHFLKKFINLKINTNNFRSKNKIVFDLLYVKTFLHIYKAIIAVINSSNLKAFKNKAIILSKKELIYLNNILNILLIFIKKTTKLQAENYSIIYYIIPKVYKIYSRLEKFKSKFKVTFLLKIN
jgi:hypothetical protein